MTTERLLVGAAARGGPVDPEASLTLFEREDGSPLAGLLHYTCHPIHGYPHRYIISGDWPRL